MVKNNIEIKRLILDYNSIVKRLNNAQKYWEKCTDEQYLASLELYKDLIRQASQLAYKLEKLLNRKLTKLEITNGINI